jgi:hypothetical protein
VIHKHQSGHGLNHYHRTGQNAWVMASARSQRGRFAGAGHGRLRLGNRGRRLECDTEKERLAVADAALHAAGTV